MAPGAQAAGGAEDAALRQIAEAVPHLVWAARPDGTVVYYSSQANRYDGLRRLDDGTWAWAPALHPDDRERTAAAWRQAVATGEPYDVEHRVRMADGTYRWHVSRARPSRDPHGAIERWYGTATDVHAMKATEEALRESEERYRLLVESAREYAILMLDPENRITYWSTGAERIFGYTEAEVLGQPGAMVFTEEDRAAGAPEHEVATATTTGRAADDRWHVRKDGTRFWANGVLETLYDAYGAVHGFTKVLRDNTARKRAEEALRESERRFRALFEESLDALLLADDDGVYVDANPAASDLLDTPRDALIGRSIADFSDVNAATYRALWGAFLARGRLRGEYRLRTGRGDAIDVEFNAVANVTPGRHLSSMRDITERKRTEAALRRLNETLEERVQERTRQVRALALQLTAAEQAERDRLAVVLHDDLQQQLFGLALLLDLLPEPEDEAARTVRARASATLSSATDLTRSLATELSPPVLTSPRLGEILGWLADRKLALHGLSVDVEVEEPCVVADRDVRALLYRVVREALFNVVKHAGTGYARVRARCTEGETIVVVEDEGAGFDPAAAREGEIGGFGMATARERVRLVGGRLSVKSAPGRGTRVRVVVPTTGKKP